METGESQGNVEDFSGVLKKEVTNPRKDTPFVVLISLLATLALARAFVLLTGAAETTTEPSTYIGRDLIIGGYHIHHFFYGFALICGAAWPAIQSPPRHPPRPARRPSTFKGRPPPSPWGRPWSSWGSSVSSWPGASGPSSHGPGRSRSFSQSCPWARTWSPSSQAITKTPWLSSSTCS